jgi:hypothetical protein
VRCPSTAGVPSPPVTSMVASELEAVNLELATNRGNVYRHPPASKIWGPHWDLCHLLSAVHEPCGRGSTLRSYSGVRAVRADGRFRCQSGRGCSLAKARMAGI